MEVFAPVTYPRRQVNPLLRDAVRVSMRKAFIANRQKTRGEVPTCEGLSGVVLTALCGFPSQSELSRCISTLDLVPASPRMMARLKALAEAIGFDGDIFADQEPIVDHRQADHGASR